VSIATRLQRNLAQHSHLDLLEERIIKCIDRLLGTLAGFIAHDADLQQTSGSHS